MARAMVDAHTGSTLMKDLNSSTCVTVHTFHLLLTLSVSVITAALSKNLQQNQFNYSKTELIRFSCYVVTNLYCRVGGSLRAPMISECVVVTS